MNSVRSSVDRALDCTRSVAASVESSTCSCGVCRAARAKVRRSTSGASEEPPMPSSTTSLEALARALPSASASIASSSASMRSAIVSQPSRLAISGVPAGPHSVASCSRSRCATFARRGQLHLLARRHRRAEWECEARRAVAGRSRHDRSGSSRRHGRTPPSQRLRPPIAGLAARYARSRRVDGQSHSRQLPSRRVSSPRLQLLKLWVSRLWLFSPERLWLASIALHRRGHWVLAFCGKAAELAPLPQLASAGRVVSPDIRLGHNSIGIVVNSEVEIGKRVKIWQNVTLSAGRPLRRAARPGTGAAGSEAAASGPRAARARGS